MAPGYWATKGSGLTLNLSAGTSRDASAGTIYSYAGGTLAMTDATTNYVYLDTAASYAPATSTSAFTSTQIPLAKVVTSGGVITTITDVRTMFFTGGGGGGTPGGSDKNVQYNNSSAFGGVANNTTSTPKYLEQHSTATPAFMQPAFSELSGSAACSQLPALTGDVTTSAGNCGTTIANNAVNSTKSAVVNTRRTCMITVGADNAPVVLVNADLGPQKRGCFVPYAATIVEITVSADAGTPSVLPQRRRGASTVADLLSAALSTAASGAVACAMASTSQTCIDGTTSSGSITLSNTSLNAGDYIELKSGTAGGTAKAFEIAVTLTVN